MAIKNDFLEFMNSTTCKKAIYSMTVILFLTLAYTEITKQPSAFIQRMSEFALIFWVARATKSGMDRKKR